MKGEILNKLETYISDKKEDIALADSLTALEANPHFIKIISQGYLVDAAVRCVAFAGSLNCTGLQEEDNNKEIIGIGKLRSYLQGIRRNAANASQNISDALDQISELEVDDSEEHQ